MRCSDRSWDAQFSENAIVVIKFAVSRNMAARLNKTIQSINLGDAMCCRPSSNGRLYDALLQLFGGESSRGSVLLFLLTVCVDPSG
jgi:hypothetical protein